MQTMTERAQQRSECLTEWEFGFIESMATQLQKNHRLTDAQIKTLSRIDADVVKNKKPLSEEYKLIITRANEQPDQLHAPEIKFMNQIKDAEVGRHKLSPNQRSWLIKIGHRLNKN